MKKFTKISLIIAAILGGVGLLFCGIATLMGGNEMIRQMAHDGELSYGNWHIGPYGVYYNDFDWDDDWYDNDYVDVGDIDVGDIDVGDVGDIDVGDVGGSGSGTVQNSYTFDAAEIKNLKLDVNAAVVDFREGTDDKNIVVELYRIHENYYDNEVKSGTLTVEYDTGHHYRTSNHAKIVIEIPKGMQFDTVEFNIGATDAEIEGLSCRDLTLYVGAGDLTTTGFTVTGLMTVSLGAGNLDIGGGTYGDVNLDCGVGELSMAGVVDGNLTADCGIGEIELELLEKSEKDYNYEISCGMGEVDVNGVSYSNISGSYQATNEGAVGTIDLDCGMGSIDVEIRK